jgi:hypothetical protein
MIEGEAEMLGKSLSHVKATAGNEVNWHCFV